MRNIFSLLLLASLIFFSAVQAQDTADAGSDRVETDEVPSEPKKKTKGALSVSSISATVYTPDGKKHSQNEVKLGEKLFKAVKLGAGQSVEVTFTPQLSGKAAKPQQAMLMASSKAYPNLSAYAVAKVKKDGSHVISLSTASVEKQLGSVGGEFEVSLLLGDPAAAVGLRGDLGSLMLPEAASDAAPQPTLLTAAYQPRNNFKPNIAHTFRAPDKRAPAVVSLVFTGLTFAPLGLLVVYLGSLGVNLQGLPSGAANLWVMLFHGGIAGMLLLYLLFWLRLNLAQTLPLVLAGGAFVAITGYKALGAVSAQRIAEAKASTGASKKAS